MGDGGARIDTLTGGAQRDVFWFSDALDGDVVITDFAISSDLIGFQGTLVNAMSDLKITHIAGAALVDWTDGLFTATATVNGVTATDLNASSNFLFV